MSYISLMICFFFNDTATTEIYTLSLHDALPIWDRQKVRFRIGPKAVSTAPQKATCLSMSSQPSGNRSSSSATDRKSTRLNSSHANISYAVFCLKKKQK